MRRESEVLKDFKNWAKEQDNVRCAILTSSRVRPDATIDFLSDYDIELYVSDLKPFQLNDEWLNRFGEIMVRWPYKPRSTGKEGWITRLVLFDDGLRFDFQITDRLTIESNQYDNGYEVLIDKDCIAKDLAPPTYSEYIINKPSKEDFETLVNEFWWDAYYVAKYLYRDELPFAKYMLDYVLRYSFLHQIINWKIGLENNWNVATGALGKDFKKLLDQETWQSYKKTFANGETAQTWLGFYEMTDLFRSIALSLSLALDYDYPEAVDENVMKFCKNIESKIK